MEIRKEPKGTAEWKRGLRGVTGDISGCKHCNRDTNTIWQGRGSERVHFTCSIECAEQLDERAASFHQQYADQGGK